MLDADLGLANLDVVLNLHPKLTLHDVFTGRRALEEAILPAPGGFSVLLAGSGLVEYSRLTRRRCASSSSSIIDQLAPRFDRILLDTGAGISDVVLYAISLADDVLVIATPEPTSMTDAYATSSCWRPSSSRRSIRLVVNQVSAARRGQRTISNQLQLVVDRFVAPQLDDGSRAASRSSCWARSRPTAPCARRVQARLLLDTRPGGPAAQALGSVAGRLAG